MGFFSRKHQDDIVGQRDNLSQCIFLLILQGLHLQMQGVFKHIRSKRKTREGYRALEQAAQRSWGVSSGNTQNLHGHSPVQPALGDPVLPGGLDQLMSRGPFQPLPFCDSVIYRCKNITIVIDFIFTLYVANTLSFDIHVNGVNCIQMIHSVQTKEHTASAPVIIKLTVDSHTHTFTYIYTHTQQIYVRPAKEKIQLIQLNKKQVRTSETLVQNRSKLRIPVYSQVKRWPNCINLVFC